jgi:hypothetical protein
MRIKLKIGIEFFVVTFIFNSDTDPDEYAKEENALHQWHFVYRLG